LVEQVAQVEVEVEEEEELVERLFFVELEF
jgi:hypothetical protein